MKIKSINEEQSGPLLYRWDDIVLSFSDTSQLRPHFHGAAELVIALENPVCTRVGDLEISALSVLIPPGTKHQNIYSDPISAVLYLDVESFRYKRLAEKMSERDSVYTGLQYEKEFQQSLVDVYARVPNAEDCYSVIVEEFLHGKAKPNNKVDSRVVLIAKEIKDNPAQDTSVRDLASQVGLSEDRLHHLFTAELGIPLHKYRIWLRLKHASQRYIEGQNLTFAAHDAGFSDAAHFSRTFSRMYGANPSQLLSKCRNSRVFSD